MQRLRQWASLAAALTIVLVCPGCWDRNEIDQLAIVTATGTDKPETTSSDEPSGGKNADPSGKTDKILGTFQIARASQLGSSNSGTPSGATGTTNTFIVEQATGDDPVDALEKVRVKLSRRFFLGQRQLIVWGEAYARDGVRAIADEVVRNPESRIRASIVVAYHEEAQTILQLPYALNRVPADAVRGMEKAGAVANVDVRQFIVNLLSKSDPYAPGIEPVPTLSKDEPTTFRIDHVAVFQKDKLVGWLNGDHAIGFLWLKGSLKGRRMTVQIPGYSGRIGVKLLQTKTTLTPVVIGKRHVKMRVVLIADDDIISNSTTLDFTNAKNERLVKTAVEEEVKTEIKSTLEELQKKYQADCVGFTERIYEKYPRLYAEWGPNWREQFSKLPVSVDVNVRVRRSGLTNASLD